MLHNSASPEGRITPHQSETSGPDHGHTRRVGCGAPLLRVRTYHRVLLTGLGAGVGGGLEPNIPKVCVSKMAQINISFCKISFFPTMKSGSEGGGG